MRKPTEKEQRIFSYRMNFKNGYAIIVARTMPTVKKLNRIFTIREMKNHGVKKPS
jgi:hypothetical protein